LNRLGKPESRFLTDFWLRWLYGLRRSKHAQNLGFSLNDGCASARLGKSCVRSASPGGGDWMGRGPAARSPSDNGHPAREGPRVPHRCGIWSISPTIEMEAPIPVVGPSIARARNRGRPRMGYPIDANELGPADVQVAGMVYGDRPTAFQSSWHRPHQRHPPRPGWRS